MKLNLNFPSIVTCDLILADSSGAPLRALHAWRNPGFCFVLSLPDKCDDPSGSSGFSKALTGRSIASTQSVLPHWRERCQDAKATRSQPGSDWNRDATVRLAQPHVSLGVMGQQRRVHVQLPSGQQQEVRSEVEEVDGADDKRL